MPISELEAVKQELAELKARLKILEADQLQAYQLQASFLPAKNTVLAGWELDYHLEAAVNLSGDFLDFFSPQPKLVYFYLADIAGSGSASALINLLVKHLIKKLALANPACSPAEICQQLNTELINLNIEKHLTLALGCINTASNQLSFCLAAQLPQPIILTANQQEVVTSSSAALGLFPTAEFKDYTCSLEANTSLCLASDGVLEVMQGEGLTAKHQAWQALVQQHQGNLNQLAAVLKKPATGWPDDLTLMTLNNFSKAAGN